MSRPALPGDVLSGSVTANTWYNGMVTNVYQYDPYGQVTLGSTAHTDFYGYNAESYNPNTGLEYLRARYYNPNKGRFFQEDTYLGNIINPLTLNRYAYVVNSPLNYVDPSGYDPRDAWDRPANYMLTAEEMDMLGNKGTQQWIDAYQKAKTTDQQWELVDAKNKYLYGTYPSLLKETIGFVIDNPAYALGTAIGVGAYAVVVYYSGGMAFVANQPLVAGGGAIATGAFSGMVVGTGYNIHNQRQIYDQVQETLKAQYGMDINNIQIYDMEKLPDNIKDQCIRYQEYGEKSDYYQEITQNALEFAMTLFLAQAVYDTGKTVVEYVDELRKKGGSGPGAWEKTNEAMSDASRNYQKFVTGAEDGMVYKVNGVKFDGFKEGTLLEAKGNYSQFVNKTTGKFQTWFNGKESLISQANRQLNAANGTKIQWFFNDEVSLNAVKNLFKNEGITDIELILKPMQ